MLPPRLEGKLEITIFVDSQSSLVVLLSCWRSILLACCLEKEGKMRNYKRTRGSRPYKTTYTEENLQHAISAVKRGKSIGNASKMFSVPKATLARKVNGKCVKKNGGQLALSVENEDRLSKIINQVALWSVPFDSLDIRYLVKFSLDKEGIRHRTFRENLPGVDWLKGFMRRHNLTLRQADSVKPKRY